MPFVPLNKISEQVVLDLTNIMNARDGYVPLTLTDVEFENIRAGEVPGSNTTVDIVAKPGFESPGLVPIHFNRLDISRFGPQGQQQLDGYYFTIGQLLAEFNPAFELGLTSAEVLYSEVDDTDTISIQIGSSLAYLPGTTLMVRDGYMNNIDRLEFLVEDRLEFLFSGM